MAGRRIDDHSSWVGKGSDGSVFPMGCKMKRESSAEGAGSVTDYPDTTEAIRKDQEASERKIRGHKQREGYRY